MKQKKIFKKLLNLNYDKETILRCRPEMDKDNIKTVRNVSLLLIVILSIITGFYLIFDNQPVRNLICIISGFFLLCIYLISRWLLHHPQGCTCFRTDLLIDLFSAVCFAVAIYLGTFAANGAMAVAPVWMFFFAVLIFNRMPLQNTVLLLIAGSVFIYSSYITKTPLVFRYDIMHSLTSIIGSICMSWSKSAMKMENILALETLRRANLQIMETVEEQEREASLLRHRASRDEMTGLFKKNHFEQSVSAEIAANPHNTHALICADIDNFKQVNDRFGHMFGDEVIKDISGEIRTIFKDAGITGRFGGDEFVIFIGNTTREDMLIKISALTKSCQKSYEVHDAAYRISLSSGISLYPRDGQSYRELFEKADIALYQSKTGQKGTYTVYHA